MKIIIANFKSNKSRKEYELWMKTFENALPTLPPRVHIILAPPFVDLMFFANRILDERQHLHTSLATQDISPFPAGAYTGAVGTKNLEGFDISHAIIGHSERRRYFHETNNDVANKVREARAAGITPIICVTKDTVTSQAHALEPGDRKGIVVAFEPVEHIGSGAADSLEDILTTKTLVTAAFGDVPYIYGGSVDLKTDPDILAHPGIDGFLVGSASLDAGTFVRLVKLIG